MSTRDVLGARIQQMVAQLPLSNGKKDLKIVVDLRKRMNPEIPPPAIGNCVWTISVPSTPSSASSTSSATSSASASAAAAELPAGNPSLGAAAAEIRSSICNILERNEISKELKWVQDNAHHGASVPLVLKFVGEVFHTEGPLLLTHWHWGERGYEDLEFGGGPGSAPVWHQHLCADALNCVFVVPAGSAAPPGGLIVHFVLHKTLAEQLKEKYSTL